MTPSTRLYAGVAFAFGGQLALSDVLAAGYNTVIVWTVHVDWDGTLFLNDTKIVSKGVYKEDQPMNLPARLAVLHKAGVEIIFSVGSGGGVHDFTSLSKLLSTGPGGPGNVIYDNFKALKKAMTDAGGDIDAIDFDNEDYMFSPTPPSPSDVMVNFGLTLYEADYKHVTLCPYTDNDVWYATMRGLVDAKGSDFVSAIHLQCYDGGAENFKQDNLDAWTKGFKDAGGNAKMIAGLAMVQPSAGPWWYVPPYPPDAPGRPGDNVVKAGNTNVNWSANLKDYLYTQNFASPMAALEKATTASNFFVYYRQSVTLDDGRTLVPGDTLFYRGTPVWVPGDARCDTFYLAGTCKDIYNLDRPGACPDKVQALFKQLARVDGGFIWFYDAMISCVLANWVNCDAPPHLSAASALAYREAISKGLG